MRDSAQLALSVTTSPPNFKPLVFTFTIFEELLETRSQSPLGAEKDCGKKLLCKDKE